MQYEAHLLRPQARRDYQVPLHVLSRLQTGQLRPVFPAVFINVCGEPRARGGRGRGGRGEKKNGSD